MSTTHATTRRFSNVVNVGEADSRRWLILATICFAALMIVLDVTVMNLALPSAQHALRFTNAGRQWIVTAYSLSFGSLLLFGGRRADLIGRKVTFLAGLAGFAAASAAGGASVSFTMLVTARACQGVFVALLAPSALSLLTTTFTDPKERGKAFGVYGAVASSGSGLGLLIGGALTSGRPAGHPGRGGGVGRDVLPGLRLLQRRDTQLARLVDVGLPRGRRRAADRLRRLAVARRPATAAAPGHPGSQPRRGAYLTMLIFGSALFGIFLFLIYHMQLNLGYSAVIPGVALLPMVTIIGVMANVGNIVLMPRSSA